MSAVQGTGKMMLGDVAAIEAEPVMSTEDVVSCILGFTQFCVRAANASLWQSARRRGWLDADGRPTEDGRALIEALTCGDCAYGVYRMPV